MTAKESKAVAWQEFQRQWAINGMPKDKQRLAEAAWQSALHAAESLLAEAERERDAFKQHCDLLTHKVITCGVAAQNPDATLTTRGAYATKWDSPQAQHVRKLRAERDALQSRLDAAKLVAQQWAIRSARYSQDIENQAVVSGNNGAWFIAAAETSERIVAELRAALGCATTGEEK